MGARRGPRRGDPRLREQEDWRVAGLPGDPGYASKKEAAVSWNKQGEPGRNGTNGINGQPGRNGTNGVNGQPGANGTSGTNGINGKNGATNVTVREGQIRQWSRAGTPSTADVLCNLGEVATGGGDSTSGSTFSVAQSTPLTTGGALPTGWHVQAVNTGGGTGTAHRRGDLREPIELSVLVIHKRKTAAPSLG